MIDAQLLLQTLEDMNDLYKQLGDKMFPQMRKRLLSVDKSSIMEGPEQLEALLHEHSISADPLVAKRLLSTLCHQMEAPSMQVNTQLSEWFVKNMRDVLQNQDFAEVFGLKHKGSGRPKGTYSVSELRIAAAHEYYLREGCKRTQAKALVQEDIGCVERQINRAIKSLKIGSHIETALLRELMNHDYDNAFGYRH